MRTLPQTRPVRLFRAVLDRGGDDDVGTHASALTYHALLSVIPVVLLAAAVVGFVFAAEPERQQQLTEAVAQAIPGLSDVVGRNIESLVQARVQAGILALAVLVWRGSALAVAGARALGRIFRIRPRSLIERRLRALAQLGVLGLATLLAVGLASVPATVGGAAAIAIGAAASLVIDIALFFLVYAMVTPPGGPPRRSHLPGAIVMGISWTALKLAGGWYVRFVVARAAAVYGAIGAVFGLLAVLSIASHAFVYGAELSAVLEERRAMRASRPEQPHDRPPPRDAGGGTARS
jgi:membrane protein